MIALATAYADSRKFEHAEQVLREGLTAFPGSPDLLANVARIQVLTGDHESAITTAEAALAVSPSHGFAMRIHAVALDGGGRLDEALLAAWRAATNHPHDRLAHFVYAELLLKAAHPQEALYVIGEALRVNPSTPDSHVLRGQILARLGRLDESTESYREALRIDPGYASAVHNIAVNGLARKRTSSALRGFLGAARLDPELGELARNNIGVALTGALRPGTAFAVVVSLFAVLAAAGPQDVALRVYAGVCTVGLVIVLVPLARNLPLRTLRSVLRTRSLLSIRLAIIVCAIPVGMLAVLGCTSAVLSAVAVLLLVVGVLVALIGRRTGG